MPGMDGHELAELANRLRPELKILQLSGREPRRGGLPMIRKPFSFEELADALRRTTGVAERRSRKKTRGGGSRAG